MRSAQEYQSYVKHLLASYPVHDAMSRAVGGDFQKIGRIEMNILKFFGLREGMSLLDFGCGSGRLASALSEIPNLQYHGVDVVEELLAFAIKRAPQTFQFHKSTGFDLPFEDNMFDFIVAFSVFTHLSQTESFLYLKEFRRLIKSGGKVIISFLEFRDETHWDVFLASVEAQRGAALSHLNAFVERDVWSLWAQRAGFLVEGFVSGRRAPWPDDALGQALVVLVPEDACGSDRGWLVKSGGVEGGEKDMERDAQSSAGETNHPSGETLLSPSPLPSTNAEKAQPETTKINPFDEEYYRSHCGPIPYSRDRPEWKAFFGNIANQIITMIRPTRVFDAGCAFGFLVEELWDRGVEAYGRDISEYAISQARSDIRPFLEVGSIENPIEGSFDLITCIEVLEHMPESAALKAIDSMASAAPHILFSSSPDDLVEPTHITVRPLRWWLKQFMARGFVPVPRFDASFVAPHAVLLQKAEPSLPEVALDAFLEVMQLRRARAQLEGSVGALRRQLANEVEANGRLRAEAARLQEDLKHAQHEADQLRRRIFDAEHALTERLAEAEERYRAAIEAHAQQEHRFRAEISDLRSQVQHYQHISNQILNSTTWRATKLLRATLHHVPYPIRKTIKRALLVIYWTITFRLKERLSTQTIRGHTSSNPVKEALPSEPFSCMDQTLYSSWSQVFDTITVEDRRQILACIDRLPYKPLISILIPAYNTPEDVLEKTLTAVQKQLYTNWEICLVDDASDRMSVVNTVQRFASDTRIRFERRTKNGHIAAASNSALAMAKGEFIALLDHDDIIPEHALFEVVFELNKNKDVDIIYSDEDRLSGEMRMSPYFKPDWDPDLLLGQNCISHFGVYRTSLLLEIGGFREGFEGSQDHELILRASRATKPERIRHIPAILYHWRQTEGRSFSEKQLQRCVEASRRAVQEHLAHLPNGKDAQVLPNPLIRSYHRIVWPLPKNEPKVSVIIPTKDKGHLLERCIEGILCNTNYKNLELIVVDNGSTERHAINVLENMRQKNGVKILCDDRPFNFSALNNQAARQAEGDFLLFLNNDIEVIEPEWLREMVSLGIRPEIGCVGAKLLYPDRTVQHAGVVLGVGSFRDGPGVAGHFGHGAAEHDPGYFGHLALLRTVSAVTAACMLVQRSKFFEVNGFDEINLPVAFNDVDLCLKIREKGYRNVWTPFAVLIHHESASRGIDDEIRNSERSFKEKKYMRERWGIVLDHDPFYNINFSRVDHNYRLTVPPRRVPPWRLPNSAFVFSNNAQRG